MSEERILPIGVTALRAEEYSGDGKSVIISLRTKYSSIERKYSVPIECFHDLILDLQRLNATRGAASIEASLQPIADAPAPHSRVEVD